MNQLVKQMRPKWMLIGFTALALMVGLGASVGLDFTEQAIAQEELPDEGPAGGEPAAGGDANAAPADDEMPAVITRLVKRQRNSRCWVGSIRLLAPVI